VERRLKAPHCAISTAFVASVAIMVALAKPPQETTNTHYQTLNDSGPNKWSSVWLVCTHLNLDAVTIAATKTDFNPDAINFDTDSADLTRTSTSTTNSAALAAHANNPMQTVFKATYHNSA